MSAPRACGCGGGGPWRFCPWCGAQFQARGPTPRPCRDCGAAEARGGRCVPCRIRFHLRGHTVGEVARRRAAGESWEDISAAFRGNRHAVSYIQGALRQAWQLAGAPGDLPPRPPGWPEPGYQTAEDAWTAYLSAKEVAVAAWLAQQVDQP